MSIIHLSYRLQDCDVFNVKPQKIYLHIESPKKEIRTKSFTITNKTAHRQIVTIENPTTEFFEISKFRSDQLNILPEKSLEVTVSCRGKLKARPYYDAIKVSCSKGCGSYVRLTASPTIRDVMKIPFDIDLGNIPLGETASYNFKIPVMKSKTPFLFLSSIYNPDVTITPMKGTVCKEPITVVISYLPRAYITLVHPIHLYLPSISVLPLLIFLTADTKPGAIGEMIFSKKDTEKSKFKLKLPFVKIDQSDKIVRKPTKMSDWNQHKTNLFLLKKDEKPRPPFELLGPFGRPLQEEEEVKKKKQLNFFKEVLSFRKSCLEPLEHNRTVLKKLVVEEYNEWDMHWKIHEEALTERGTCDDDSMKPLFRRQRLIKAPALEEDFVDIAELPNLWFIRRHILNKFIEAVRRIVVHNRLLFRLESLKKVCQDRKRLILLRN